MEKKISVIPYLSFKGNCEEAVHTYINAFGGEILYISRWDENSFACRVYDRRIAHGGRRLL